VTPRVSLIVPTGDRSLLLRRCIAQARAQTFVQPIEIVIVDGGHRQASIPHFFAADRVVDDFALRYVRVAPTTTVGERRNIACEHASGELIAHFDDDDFYHPEYLSTLVGWWDTHQPIDLGGSSQFYHYDVLRKRGWRTNLWDTGHPYGATFLYRKSLWKQIGGFQALQRGEDQEFFLAVERQGDRIAALQCPEHFVYMRHGRNVSGPIDPIWHPQWTADVRQILGDAVSFYDDLAELVTPHHVSEEGVQFHLPRNVRSFPGARK
jgi:glycosyltransferase involved in cell wall biosynthesis